MEVDAVSQLMRLGAKSSTPVALDDFGYLLEGDPTLDSVIASALGPAGQTVNPGQARLVLCGSAIAMMRALLAGEAPLRGRAGMELVMQPFDHRQIASILDWKHDLALAMQLFAVIGGVIGYATDMVDHDLPERPKDFSRWVANRVLSPTATLHHQATTLLAEDPTLSSASPTLSVIAIGEAKAGETVKNRHLRHLERARAGLGPRAAGAKLLLFGTEFDAEVADAAKSRHDVDLVDPARLYRGD